MDDYIENSDVIEKNLKYFIENHGDIYDSYESYGKMVHGLLIFREVLNQKK